MSSIVLTDGQQEAVERITAFAAPSQKTEKVLVLSGYAGTGKTTVMKTAVEKITEKANLVSKLRAAAGRSGNSSMNVGLTATTNKAVEALEEATKMDAKTIHSYLGIRVAPIYGNKNNGGRTKYRLTTPSNYPQHSIVVIDEASFIDQALLDILTSKKYMGSAKIILVGDPAQLAPVKGSGTPAFDQGFPTIHLTEVVRQGNDSQIIDASTAFRDCVRGEKYAPFLPNNKDVIYLEKAHFERAILDEFARAEFKEKDAKILSWTNARTKYYNDAVKESLEGTQELLPGDYAVCNNYFSPKGKRGGVPTDSVVLITKNGSPPDNGIHSKPAYNEITFRYKNEKYTGQMYHSEMEYQKYLNYLIDNNLSTQEVERGKLDVRPMYASTINKSQGSTYKKVFIDLNDINRCRQLETANRLLYVAFSRASGQVILTGDVAYG